MISFSLEGDYIKLDQLLKATDLVSSGGEAKQIILDGLVLVNQEVCLQRGRKIKKGDIVSLEKEKIKIL